MISKLYKKSVLILLLEFLQEPVVAGVELKKKKKKKKKSKAGQSTSTAPQYETAVPNEQQQQDSLSLSRRSAFSANCLAINRKKIDATRSFNCRYFGTPVAGTAGTSAMEFSDDGLLLASAVSIEKTIRMWPIYEVAKRGLRTTPFVINTSHELDVCSLAFSSDTSRIFSGSCGVVTLNDIQT